MRKGQKLTPSAVLDKPIPKDTLFWSPRQVQIAFGLTYAQIWPPCKNEILPHERLGGNTLRIYAWALFLLAKNNTTPSGTKLKFKAFMSPSEIIDKYDIDPIKLYTGIESGEIWTLSNKTEILVSVISFQHVLNLPYAINIDTALYDDTLEDEETNVEQEEEKQYVASPS